MEYIITLDITVNTDEIIGVKEQIASALENIGAVKIIDIEECK